MARWGSDFGAPFARVLTPATWSPAVMGKVALVAPGTFTQVVAFADFFTVWLVAGPRGKLGGVLLGIWGLVAEPRHDGFLVTKDYGF